MSATIGAALKKIAVSLLTDKKVIKTIGGIIIGIIIIVVMPIIAVVSVFNGSMDIDTDKLKQSIQANISAEKMKNLQLINDTMTEVENQLKNKKLSDYNTQAEVIYLFSLSDKSENEDFVKNFVSCFKKNQSDEDLIKTVNQKFGTEIKYDEFQKMMQSIKGAEISTAGFTDKTTKNNLDLVKWCENAYKMAGVMCMAVTVKSAQSNTLTNRQVCFPATTRQAVKCDRSEKSGSEREYATA